MQDRRAPQLSLASVSERDVDLLLLEEFVSTPSFVQWFTQRIRLEMHQPRVVRAGRSITQSLGESDLEVFIEDGSGRFTCLLIENKIYASFEPRQAERYRLRGAAYVQNGRCQGFTTILVAPRAYFGADPEDRKGFDASLFYEAIRDWFSASALGGRVTYKTHLLDAAVTKAKFGYQPEEDAPVTDFWRSYWEIAVRMAPELEMPEPLAKPARAGFIYFRPPTLPKGVRIVHKLRHGYLDLQLAQLGRNLSQVRAKFGNSLLPGMTIARAEKSAVIRQIVPVFDTAGDFGAQEQNVLSCLERARGLLQWYLSVKGSDAV